MPDRPENRRRRLTTNGLLSAVSWFLPLLLAFIVTPIVVKGLGNEIYGLYSVVLGFISYSFTFGIGKTVAKYIAEYRATGETDKIAETVSTTFWFSLLIGLFGAAIIVFTARLIVTDVLSISAELQSQAITALYLAAAIMLVLMLSNVFQFALQGLHRFDLFVILTNLSGLFLNIGNIVLVWNGYGVTELLVWNLLVAMIIGALFYFWAARLLPEFKFTLKVRPNLRDAVLRYGSSIIFSQLFANFLLLFERGWIVRNFGAEALTFYVVPMALGLYLHGFIASLVLVLFPRLNELLTDREALVGLYQRSTKLIFCIIVFSLVTGIAGGKIFLGVWIGNDFADRSYSILVAHLISFALLAVATIAWQLTESFRRPGLNAVTTFLLMAISAPLMIILSANLQATGVAIGRLTGVLVVIPLIIFSESRFLGGVFWGFWFSILWKTALAAGVTALIEIEVFSHFQSGWTSLIFGGLCGLVTYAIVILMVGFFSKEERRLVTEMLFRNKQVTA